MSSYKIFTARDLSEKHIFTILRYWAVPAWSDLSAAAFREKFEGSEFHVLLDEGPGLLAIARINFHFSIRVDESVYRFSEFVGFVSVEKGKGYGRRLLQCVVNNLAERKVETIGFCTKALRDFYLRNDVKIMYDAAKHLREKEGDKWVEPEDDDILCIQLSDDCMKMLQGLSVRNVGYLDFKGPD